MQQLQECIGEVLCNLQHGLCFAHHAARLHIFATARTPILTQHPTAQLATVSSVVLQAEGLELMQLILKEKRVARLGSLKVLDFATTRCTPACERWVDLTGLKQLFAIFMGKSKVLPAAIKQSVINQTPFQLSRCLVYLYSGAYHCRNTGQSC